jgi:hypothetical protein
MPKYSGITTETYKRFLVDAGEVRIGYVDGDNPGVLLGATRGGNVYTIETDIRSMPADGAKGDVKGGRRIVKVTAKMAINLVEFTPDILLLALPGSTTEEVPSGSPTHDEIRRKLAIALENYSDNVVLLGELSGSARPVVLGLENVLSTGNFELNFQEADEAVLKLEFTGHFDPDDLENEPWFIRYPLDVLTTEGA